MVPAVAGHGRPSPRARSAGSSSWPRPAAARATWRATTCRRRSPAVADHLEAWCASWCARYPVDGFHLDFIRYPGRDYDYSRRGPRGLPTAPRRRPTCWAGPRARPRPGTSTGGTSSRPWPRASWRAARAERPRARGLGGGGARRDTAVEPEVPGLAGLARRRPARRALPDDLHPGQPDLPRPGRAGAEPRGAPARGCGPASAPTASAWRARREDPRRPGHRAPPACWSSPTSRSTSADWSGCGRRPSRRPLAPPRLAAAGAPLATR